MRNRSAVFIQANFVLCVGVVAAFVFAVSTSAQAPLPPTPKTPDLLGIYPGMAYQAARAQLQKHAANVAITPASNPALGFGMQITDPRNPDQIDVWFTQEPNDSNVWMITRAQIYYPGAGGPPLSFSAVLSALHDKCGKETMSSDHPVSLILYWIYDQSGKLLGTAPAGLQACDGGQYMGYISGPPQTLNDQQKACYASYFAVKATMNRSTDPQLLGSYNVQLVNLPYAYKAAMNTVAAKNAAANKARQDQINNANQNKPTF